MRTCYTANDLDALQGDLRAYKGGLLGFDTETTGLELDRQMVGFSVASDDGEIVAYVPVAHVPNVDLFSYTDQKALDAINAPRKDVTVFLNWLFSDDPTASFSFIMHNAGFDIRTLLNEGVYGVRDRTIHDTMLLSWLDAPERKGGHSLGNILSLVGGEKLAAPWERKVGNKTVKIPIAAVPVDRMARYACADVQLLGKVFYYLKQSFVGAVDNDTHVLWREYMNVELPTSRIVEQMAYVGIKVNTDVLTAIQKDMDARIEQTVATLAGLLEYHPRDTLPIISSPAKLSKLLHECLKWWPSPIEAERTVSGSFTVAKLYLEGLASGGSPVNDPKGQIFAKELLVLRKLEKLRSTYTQTMLDMLDSHSRLHGSFKQHGTGTGRFSSSEPNLQNIPRTPKATSGMPDMRSVFVAEEGYTLVDSDYSQLELRLLAHFSKDATLCHAFETGGDPHQATADKLRAKGINVDRTAAKTINFGIAYGMGPNKLSASLGITTDAAKALLDSYFAEFPGILTLRDKCIAEAKSTRRITTLFKRYRDLPGINAPDKWVVDPITSKRVNEGAKTRAACERAALNTRIQGSAADVVKMAMVVVDRKLHEAGYTSSDVRLLLQIHDELLYEVRTPLVEPVSAIIQDGMENCVKLHVKLEAKPSHGRTWSEAK